MPYKFERDELVKLLIRAYDEGNYGFLDLSESVAEKLIEECHGNFEPTINATYAARNFSHDSVNVDNLVVLHSNQLGTDVSLMQKQFD